ncbi:MULTISPECIES: hypothetical protein [Thermococcus]|uniref:Uncharacterized protein n=1 Tax=Thermococcus barophilus TaxID=55802 RepID=A0A0S1XDD4_THEBA|nr:MULTISPECIES: hypothetical protein [Thermococcus]ALM75789.1 conserved exported hypothetical protein [Thermococcus barophilus]WRS51762.1 hypothetical protein VFC49_06585 [Thermococcus sp. SY098]
MTTFRKAINYPLIKGGLIFLALALLLSLVSMYSVEKSYFSQGTLGVGHHIIGDKEFESNYFVINRTLIISSQNASVVVIQRGKINSYTLNNQSVRLTPTSQPEIRVESGNVSYSYRVYGVDYPYSLLSLLAFVFMIVGSALSVYGYIRFMEGAVEKTRKRRR